MKRKTLPLLILPLGVLQGCIAGPAVAQPDPIVTRLDRIDSGMVDMTKDNALLRERMTDNRFITLGDVMTAGFQLIADTMEVGFQRVTDKMIEHNEQRIVDNTRNEARITALEEAARIPWWIIGSICVGAPAVGGGSFIAGNARGKKTTNESEA